jgi:hypothetical protein
VAREMSEDRNAMSFPELVAWAWRETPPVHEHAANLLIHLFAVPLFVTGNFLLIAGLIFGWGLLLAGFLSIAASLAMQKFGHSLERNQVHSFDGSRDFVRRLYAEQFFNFWRFLLSGKWYASLRARNGNA